MDSFHPGKKTLIIGLLTAFLTTRNGRNLGAEIIHKHILQSLLFLLPIRLRCKIVERIMSSPIHKGRKLMAAATKPWGVQKDYIWRIRKETFSGSWIIRDAYKHHNNRQGSSQWLKEAVNKADLVVYYIHGGGFRNGDSTMYMESFIHIIEYLRESRGMEVCIFSVDYGRMPEVNYRRTQQDCIDGYSYLVNEAHVDVGKVVFAGDSAGGNLVATCIMSIRDTHVLPMPAGNVQISPWAAIDTASSIRKDKVYVDCLTPKMMGNHHGDYFLEQNSGLSQKELVRALCDPRYSPMYGSFTGFCPTLVTYGGTEIFQHDVQTLIGNLKRDGVKVDVITRSNAPHIWLISSILSPSWAVWKADCTKVADWCADCVGHTSAPLG